MTGRILSDVEIIAACNGLREDQFAFTVQALGSDWDVYHANLYGADRTVAFRLLSNGTYQIGCFAPETLGPFDVLRLLAKLEPH